MDRVRRADHYPPGWAWPLLFGGLILLWVAPRDLVGLLFASRAPVTSELLLGLALILLAGLLIAYGARWPFPMQHRATLTIVLLLPAAGLAQVAWQLSGRSDVDVFLAAEMLFLNGVNIGSWLARTRGSDPDTGAEVPAPLNPDPSTLSDATARPPHEGSSSP
jgi:hypothetical protein